MQVVRVCVISDTHEQHDRVTVPPCDVLIHAGDASYRGDLPAMSKFFAWIAWQPATYKVLIAGNHDWNFAYHPDWSRDACARLGITYLQDSEAIIDGLKFYGSPWQPDFYNWAFNLPRGHQLRAKWQAIPDGVDVLVTHGPPLGTLDLCDDGRRLGCRDLATRLVELRQLKLHAFGHIHHSYGRSGISVNASICTEQYKPDNAPIVVDL